MFGLAYLLGIQLMPRIRNWKDLTLHRPGRGRRYEHIEALFTDTVDWSFIETHLPDMLRVALSIKERCAQNVIPSVTPLCIRYKYKHAQCMLLCINMLHEVTHEDFTTNSSPKGTSPFRRSFAHAHQSITAISARRSASADHNPERSVTRQQACTIAASTIRQMARNLSHNLPKGAGASLDSDDLESAGFMGLLDAVDKYDSGTNLPFLAFARFRIRGAMIDAMRENDHLSRHRRLRIRRVQRTVHQLTQELHASPTCEQVAERLGVTVSEVENAMAPVRLLSLDAPVGNDDGKEGRRAEIADSEGSPEDLFYSRQRRLIVREAVQKLDSRHRQIIHMMYDQEMNQREVAVALGVSPVRLGQLHTAALKKLQMFLIDTGLPQRRVCNAHAILSQLREAA